MAPLQNWMGAASKYPAGMSFGLSRFDTSIFTRNAVLEASLILSSTAASPMPTSSVYAASAFVLSF